MVGDRMDTDVVAGIEAGLRTFLVLSGSTRLADVEAFPFRPTEILDSVQDLVERVPQPSPSRAELGEQT